MNKKYILIKTYPGSPELGVEVFYTGRGYTNVNGMFYFPIETIENHPEFWKEIVGKDYEILESECSFGQRHPTVNLSDHENELLFNQIHKIKKVKRLSDGIIFTIGDLVNYNKKSNYGNWNINNFLFKDNKILARSENNCICEFIEDLKHVKTPLFITRDGVMIYENDKYWAVHLHELYVKNSIAINTVNGWNYSNGEYLLFATNEAAEKYVENNKPIYSKKQIIEALDYANGSINWLSGKQLFKKKLEL